MNIVVVNYAYDPRLADAEALLSRYHSLTDWCEALVAAGASRVTVVQRFRHAAVVSRGGVDYRLYGDHRHPIPGMTAWSPACHRLVAAADADVAHVNGLEFAAPACVLRLALPSRAAIVVQDHGGGGPTATAGSRRHALRRRVRGAMMRAIDGFLFTSAAQAEPWEDAGLINGGQAIYQVLEASTRILPVNREAAIQQTGTDGRPAVLWVGRLNANKDPLTVIDGFERCLDSLPDATLSMIFDNDELRPAVDLRLRASPRLADRVRLVGRVPRERIATFYSAADLFVLGSHHEGSGYALIEACACGLWPVVTDIPPFRVITGGGAIGALWPPGNSTALADAMVRAADADPSGARKRVRAHFERELSWPVLARSAMVAYRDACARRRRERA